MPILKLKMRLNWCPQDKHVNKKMSIIYSIIVNTKGKQFFNLALPNFDITFGLKLQSKVHINIVLKMLKKQIRIFLDIEKRGNQNER